MEEKIKSLSKYENLTLIILGVILFLIASIMFFYLMNIFKVNLTWLSINISTLTQRIAVGIVVAFLATISLILVIPRLTSKGFRLKSGNAQQRKLYERSMNNNDMAQARKLHENSAINKVKSNNLENALIGVQEIVALGSSYSFLKGFNALAVELAKRRDWRIRIPIVEALSIIAAPIRTEIGKSKSASI